jgi:hypothetical protein
MGSSSVRSCRYASKPLLHESEMSSNIYVFDIICSSDIYCINKLNIRRSARLVEMSKYGNATLSVIGQNL